MGERERPEEHTEDRFFDVEALSRYCGISVKTLRRYMEDPTHPLPNHHVHVTGLERGRILIAKREFDAWVASFPPLRLRPAKVERLAPAPVARRAR
jgi:predicted DNA-binding transcriptional regulator AlpA